jgi:hybrid cluster-associated redox disulfide protein
MPSNRLTIRGNRTVAEVLAQYPAAARVFCRYRMSCVGCTMAPFETLDEVARTYGLDPRRLLEDLRRLSQSQE